MNTRFFLLCTLVALSLIAAPPAHTQTQLEMNEEAAADFKKADAELNKVYQHVLGQLTPKQQEQVRQTQRAWLKYRDLARTEAGMIYEGGSIRPLIESTTLTSMTQFRIKQLRSLIEP